MISYLRNTTQTTTHAIASTLNLYTNLYTQKRKIWKHIPKKVILTEQVSTLIQHNTPLKFKDPGAPTISCIIGSIVIRRDILDLGAGVNLLPYSV
jgi:hypothetical protein